MSMNLKETQGGGGDDFSRLSFFPLTLFCMACLQILMSPSKRIPGNLDKEAITSRRSFFCGCCHSPPRSGEGRESEERGGESRCDFVKCEGERRRWRRRRRVRVRMV